MSSNAPQTMRNLSVAAILALVLVILAVPVSTAGQSANAQSGDYPDAITVEDQTFIFDRVVPVARQALERIGQQAELQILARGSVPPFDAVYVSAPNRAEDELARYLPSGPNVADACPAQAADIPTATAGDASYAFAGFEEDVSTGELQGLGETEIGGEPATLYGSPDASGTITEFFAESSQGLYRFVQLRDGVPVSLPDEIPFGDQTLSDAQSTGADLSTLNQVGCIGPFPAYALETEAPFSEVYAQIGGTVVSFDVSEATAEQDEEPGETPVENAQDATTTPEEPPAANDEEATPVDETAGPDEEIVDPTVTEAEEGQEEINAGTLATGRPDAFPLTLEIGEQNYLFDRMVLVDIATLTLIEEQDGLTIYSGPGDAVFATASDSPEGQAARYLPIIVGSETLCAAEALMVGEPFVINEVPYAFAGVEQTLTTAQLQLLENYSVQVSGQPVDAYAAPGATDPLTEIFLDTQNGLLRFVSLAEDGIPAQLGGSIPFGEQTLSEPESVDVDVSTLTKVGCLGAFPAFAPAGETEPPFSTLYVALSGTVIQFQVEGGQAAETETPTEEATATEAATETVAPTETPVPPTETEAPTETPVPPTETEIPTETPVPATDTPVPTATPVPPTETPAPTATVVPATETPPQPTATPVLGETPAPTSTDVPPTETEVPATETPVPPTEAEGTGEAPTQVPSPVATATRELAPVAVVPTLPPNVPSPAAVAAEPRPCTGFAGEYNARGLPEQLPSRIQLSGIAYTFVQIEDPSDAGELTRLGCVGPFTVMTTDQAPQDEVLYLRFDQAPEGRPSLFRYEAGTTFNVQFEVAGNAQVLATGDESYRVAETWQRAAYSSVSVILYTPDGEDLTPGQLYAKRVDASVIGEYVTAEEAGEVSDAVGEDAATYEINPDLTIGGTRYVLVAVWTPAGTTTNGFVTLFAPRGAETPDRLLGINPLQPGLLIYQLSAGSG